MNTTVKVNIFWFRRDLRLQDNNALFNALKDELEVLPIFIFDKNTLKELPENDARVTFIHENLVDINNLLKKCNSSLALFYGKPQEVFKRLIAEYNIDTVFTNHDYEPYAISRDQQIRELLKSEHIHFKTFKDQVIYERDEITKDDGSPYKVYTPYSKKWLNNFREDRLKFYPSENLTSNFIKNVSFPFLSLKDIGFVKSTIKVEDYNINSNLINQYESTRNFPSLNSTSKLGPHLRFGTISIRKIVEKASQQNDITFLKELIWRDFFIQILWHFPHTITNSFKPKYDNIKWRNKKEEFILWCAGNTGYPLVDAGMRELNTTGFMHNRVRMIVGSFLCKHLLIDWRWGEAYFAEKLNDYEMASNVGNWQWVAGCGVDAAPYFRIFNPTTQIKKFDKNLKYIKQWVPEFQELAYPQPIVEHNLARERCLRVYRAALN